METVETIWRCLLACKVRCQCCESQNPDDMNPPVPMIPIPFSKRAVRNPNDPPYQSTFDRPVIPIGDPRDAPGRLDVLRYRHHYGVNLGGYFVLERWLHDSMFIQGSSGTAELDAAFSYVNKYGVEAARLKWESHWASALSDDQLKFLVEAGCTSVRLPIGHWIVGVGYCKDTPFGSNVSGVYKNGWKAVKDLCARLHNNGIGVLLDLHALPYGANRDDHSGTSTHRADFWTSQEYRDIAARCLQYMTHEIYFGNVMGVIGLQICNEPEVEVEGLHDWYQDIVIKLSQIDATVPIYMSDGWDFSATMNFAAPLSLKDARRNPIVIDTHKYYCHDAKDIESTPTKIITRIAPDAGSMKTYYNYAADKGCVDFIIGEYSCVLDNETWGREPTCNRAATVKQFGQMQCSYWQEVAGGTFFWNAKMDWMPGGEWGFVEMTDRGCLVAPSYMHWQFVIVRQKNAKAQEHRYQLRNVARDKHSAFWERTAWATPPKEELERYERGWDQGFEDAAAFFMARAKGKVIGATIGGDKIGFLSLWTTRRALEFKIEGDSTWRWKQGFKDGVKGYEKFVGITYD